MTGYAIALETSYWLYWQHNCCKLENCCLAQICSTFGWGSIYTNMN